MLNNQTRHTTPKGTLTREEKNLYRYYSALFNEGNDPKAPDYAPFGSLVSLADEISEAHARDGIAGLKKYIIALGNSLDPRYKRLVKILSSATTDSAEEGIK